MSIICVLRIQGLLHTDAYLIVVCVCHTATKNIPRGMFQGILQKFSPTSWQYLFNKNWFIYTNNTTVPLVYWENFILFHVHSKSSHRRLTFKCMIWIRHVKYIVKIIKKISYCPAILLNIIWTICTCTNYNFAQKFSNIWTLIRDHIRADKNPHTTRTYIKMQLYLKFTTDASTWKWNYDPSYQSKQCREFSVYFSITTFIIQKWMWITKEE
jgi:hypothetical protein